MLVSRSASQFCLHVLQKKTASELGVHSVVVTTLAR